MLKTAKVVGLNSDTQAALALISCPQAQIELRLFTVVYCDLEDAFSRIRQALFEAESVFYASSQSLSARLSETLEAIRHSLDDAQDAQVILAATEEDESGTALYLLGQGADLEAYLLRGEKRTGLGDMTNEHQLISGILQKGDRVILSTKSLTDFLGDHLQKVVNLPLENLEDEIALYLPQAQICPLAAIFIEEEKPQEEVVEEVLLPQEKAVSSHSFSLPPVLSRQSLISLPGKFIPRSRKTFMVLAIVLFILISGGIIFSIKHQQGVKTQDDFTKYFLAAQDQYQKAQSLKDADTNTSLQSFVQAQDLLARALKINPHDSKALELQKQIDNSSGDILKIYQVKDFPLWLDTDLVKKGFVPQDLSLSHGKLLVLDTNQGTLVNIDLATKSPDILAGQDKLGEAKIASLNGSTAWVFSQDKGLLRIDTTDNTLTTAVKPDSDWGNIVDIYGFAGNVYLLDEFKNQIWKYMPITAGYADKREYLRQDTKADFAGARRMEIDSSIWVLKRNEIIKYTQGAPDFFSLSGLDKPIKEPKALFVSDQTDNLYLLDSGNNRLLVLDKKGNYISQYQSDQFGEFSDLVVDEAGKKAYFLSGSKIFQMDLR